MRNPVDTLCLTRNLLFLADGAARVGATVFGELLNATFANIGQRAIRRVARETFEQLMHTDLRFHLSRQTGGLTRAIDRGTKYVMSCAFYFRTEVLCKGYHFPAASYPFPYSSDCAGDLYGLRDLGNSVSNKIPCIILMVFLDIQIWMGLCCDYGWNTSGIYVVYCSNNLLAVSEAAVL